MKLVILFCLLSLVPMMICEKNEEEAKLLQKLGNLPHRNLGLLWWNMKLHPERSDYARNYLIAYMMASDGELIQEGMRIPVISILAVRTAIEFPKDIELQAIRKIVMHNHFNHLEEDKAK